MSDKQQSDFDNCSQFYENENSLDLNRQILTGDKKGRGERQNHLKFVINQRLERFNIEI